MILMLWSWVCVSEGDLYFTQKLHNYTAVEKDEVRLVCELSKSAADVKWFKDGKEITPSKNIAISSDGKKRILMVRKAEKSNIGAYTCDCGSDKTTANLNIEGRFNTHPGNQIRQMRVNALMLHFCSCCSSSRLFVLKK